jgi:hypothetical protein
MPFRPGEPFRPRAFKDPCSMQVAMKIQFYYHSALIAMARLELHIGEKYPCERQHECKKRLMNSSRTIIELTTYVDVEAYTPIW